MVKIKGWRRTKTIYPGETDSWASRNSFLFITEPIPNLGYYEYYLRVFNKYTHKAHQKLFKSKSQALTYAKNYMRRHPNG